MKIEQIFVNTISQKILKFLAENSEKIFFDSEIAKNIDISVGACNQSLKELFDLSFVTLEKKGRMNFYQLNSENILIKQFKVFITIQEIYPFLEKIKSLSLKITLFGSSSRGENLSDSDIDIFILTRDKVLADRMINSNKNKKIKAIIKSPTEMVNFEKKDPVFINEIERGIKLWESKDEFRI